MKSYLYLNILLFVLIFLFFAWMFNHQSSFQFQSASFDNLSSRIPEGMQSKKAGNRWKGLIIKRGSHIFSIYHTKGVPDDTFYSHLKRFYGKNGVEFAVYTNGFAFRKKVKKKERLVSVFTGPDSLIYWVELRSNLIGKNVLSSIDTFYTYLTINNEKPTSDMSEQLKKFRKSLPFTLIHRAFFTIGLIVPAYLIIIVIMLIYLKFGGKMPKKLRRDMLIVYEEGCTVIYRSTFQYKIFPGFLGLLNNGKLCVYSMGKFLGEIDRKDARLIKNKIKINKHISVKVKDLQKWKSQLDI